jgi:thiol:disulfide interchange protein
MPAAPRLEDAALDRLLVAMAVLKGGMGAVLVGAAAWMLARMRGGGADHPAWTALHLVAAGLMAAGLVPMLTLSAPAMGAGMFHVGMVVGVVATLGDPRLRAALGRAVDARRHRR